MHIFVKIQGNNMHIFVKIQGNDDRQPWLRQCHMLDVGCHMLDVCFFFIDIIIDVNIRISSSAQSTKF